ncbi:MAG: ABC transporter permease [Chloroflexi bacterium]|nr:ABC transporter permease [Chloroflexota bacterium]
MTGIVLISLLVVMAGLAPLGLTSPLDQDLESRFVKASFDHPFGTDQFGRDQLSRVVHASRQSLIVASLVAVISGLGGGVLGIASGYVGGKFDLLVQRIVDALIALPLVVLALVAVTAYPNSRLAIVIVLSIGFAPIVVRVTRASVLSMRTAPFVEAARALGTTDLQIVVRHIVPNVMGPWLIVAGTQVGVSILAESSLSFLGFGAPISDPSLGSLLGGEAQTFLHRAPWLIIWPGITISLLVLSINLLFEGFATVPRPRHH